MALPNVRRRRIAGNFRARRLHFPTHPFAPARFWVALAI